MIKTRTVINLMSEREKERRCGAVGREEGGERGRDRGEGKRERGRAGELSCMQLSGKLEIV